MKIKPENWVERLEPFGLLLINYGIPWNGDYYHGVIRIPITMLAFSIGCILGLIF